MKGLSARLLKSSARRGCLQPGNIPVDPLNALGFKEKLLTESEEQLKRRGIVLLIAGFLVILGYPLMIILFPSPPLRGLGWFIGIFFLTVGMVLWGLGLRYFTYRRVKRLRQYAAARTAATLAGANPSVMVRCRNCGHLESEGATYCSRCSKPL